MYSLAGFGFGPQKAGSWLQSGLRHGKMYGQADSAAKIKSVQIN